MLLAVLKDVELSKINAGTLASNFVTKSLIYALVFIILEFAAHSESTINANLNGYKTNFGIITIVLILFNQLFLISQSIDYNEVLSTHIELGGDTLLLGEPRFIHFVLNNNSEESVYVGFGGDYRSGRKHSYRVEVITSNQDTLKLRPWGWSGGGLSFIKEIKSGESRRFKLFLAAWVEIEKADTYTVCVSKHRGIPISPSYPLKEGESSQRIYKKSCASLTVVEDDERLGEFISDVIAGLEEEKEIQARIKAMKLNRWSDDRDKSEERFRDYIRIIKELKDDRVIPFLIECFEKQKYISAHRVINNLSKYPNNKVAFEFLQRVAVGPYNPKSKVFRDSISIAIYSSNDNPRNALKGVMRSNDERVMEFLFSKKNNEFPDERYMILDLANTYLSEEQKRILYNYFLDDEHIAVAKKAKEHLEELDKE